MLIHNGQMTFLQVMSVFMAIFMSALSVGQVSAQSESFPKAKIAASAIFEMIDSKPEIDSSSTEGDILKNINTNTDNLMIFINTC